MTDPVASFEVPIRPSGANPIPEIGQRSPSDSPRNAPKGISETRAPAGRSSASRGGMRKITSSSASITIRCPDRAATTDSAESV